jgi:hypothetical protein
MNKKYLQDFLTDHWIRIKKLQNSNDPHKQELIALLSKEYSNAKKLLNICHKHSASVERECVGA